MRVCGTCSLALFVRTYRLVPYVSALFRFGFFAVVCLLAVGLPV